MAAASSYFMLKMDHEISSGQIHVLRSKFGLVCQRPCIRILAGENLSLFGYKIQCIVILRIVGIFNIRDKLTVLHTNRYVTRMHSSRMRTARSLTVSHCIRKNWKNHARPPPRIKPRMPPGATTHTTPPPRSNHARPPGATTHAPPEQPRTPPLWTEWQTGVKYYFAPNFVCGR